MKEIRLCIFASGGGSNAENIISYFQNHNQIEVVLVLTNNRNAGVILRCNKLDVPCAVFSKEELNDGTVSGLLKDSHINLIVLAGFLLKIPIALIKEFPERILNIHPALLPGFGGKGMYGDHVHRAVLEAGEKVTGITIHLVNEEYDKGKILYQSKIEVHEGEGPKSLAQRIHQLEYAHFPRVIEEYVQAIII